MSTSRMLLATVLLGFAGAAQAATGLEVLNQGENFDIQYAPDHTGNIVGGGFAREVMPGDDSLILYADPALGRRAPGIPVLLGGHNDNVAYLPPPASMPASLTSRGR